MRLCLALAAFVLLAPLSGCFTFVSYGNFVASAAPITHSTELEAVTVTTGTQGRPETHVLVRVDDGRRVHSADLRRGRFSEVTGPLPPSTVRCVVVAWHGPWLDRERLVIAPGDPVRRPAADGALGEPTPLTERDLAEAEIVLVRGSQDLSAQPGRELDLARIAPDPARTRVSGPFSLGDDVVSVEAVTLERRSGALVCVLLARTTSGERVRFESVGGSPLTRTPTEDDLPEPDHPLVVVADLEAAAPGGSILPVTPKAAIERRARPFTEKDAREATVVELRRDGEAGPWRVRFRRPPGAFLDERKDPASVSGPTEVSAGQVAGGVVFGLLLPVTAALDLATLPFQVVLFAISPPQS